MNSIVSAEMSPLNQDVCFDHEHCPIAKTMGVIGSKWKPMLLYMIASGVNRFGRLEKSIGGLSRDALNRSLREMEADGLLARQTYNERVLRVEYSLTERGRSLLPVVRALYDWGAGEAAQNTRSRS